LLLSVFIIAILVGVKDILLWLKFAFSWWFMMLSISARVYQSCVYLLCRNRYSNLLSIFKSSYLSLYYWVVNVLCAFWTQVTCQIYDLQTFSPILWLVFSLSLGCLWKHRNFNWWSSDLSIVLFFSLCTWCSIQEAIA